MTDEPRRDEPNDDAVLDQVRDALRGLRYGEVRLLVHDGAVVQIERIERKRLLGRRPE